MSEEILDSELKQQLDSSADAMDALLAYANGTTGQADVNIGDAIKTLCDGYGGGTQLPGVKAISSGRLTIAATTITAPTVQHNLGEVPDVIVAWSPNAFALADDVACTGGCAYVSRLPQNRSGNTWGSTSLTWSKQATSTYFQVGPSSTTANNVMPTATEWTLCKQSNSYQFRANSIFFWIAVKFDYMEG